MYGTSIAKLYEETGWHTLAKRREKANLVFMYKIVNNRAPKYLRSPIPDAPAPDTFTRDTRQQFNLPRFRSRTVLFDKSFFPSTVRSWNELPIDVRNSESVSVFKSKISKTVIRPIKFPELYNFGKRYVAVIHTRLRLEASQLNFHLHKIGDKNI